MSDTAEYPAAKAPEPLKELWGVWDVTAGEWERRGGSSYRMNCFTLEKLAAGYARSLTSRGGHVYVPHRLIPPTPNP